MAEKFSKLHLAAFTIETLGHMKGLEESLLPQAEFVRKVDEALKQLKTAMSYDEIGPELVALIRENAS